MVNGSKFSLSKYRSVVISYPPNAYSFVSCLELEMSLTIAKIISYES